MVEQVTIPDPGTLLEEPHGTVLIDGLGSAFKSLFGSPKTPGKADSPLVHPFDVAKNVYESVYDVMAHDWQLPWYIAFFWASVAGAVCLLGGVLGAVVIWVLSRIGTALAAAVLKFIDEARQGTDVSTAQISVLGLNELLGVDFSVDDMPTGTDAAGHIARAERIGGLFLQQILGEFAGHTELQPQDGVVAASRLLGFNVNFASATALVGLLGQFGTFGFIDQFREFGVEIARNLGLGRLSRGALRPVIQTLMAVPMQWMLNKQFHPTQFKIGELVNPFSGAVMDEQIIFDTAELEGYTHDKAAALIKLHRKKLTEPDLELLLRWKQFDQGAVTDQLTEMGWPVELHPTLFTLADRRRADLRLTALIDKLETRVEDGHMTVDELSTALDNLPLGDTEKSFILAATTYTAKVPSKHLTIAEIQSAFEQGVLTVDDLSARFAAQGFSPDDVNILTILTLAKFAAAEAVAAAKKAAADAKAARAAASAARAGAPKATKSA